jgi:hypothetical protein
VKKDRYIVRKYIMANSAIEAIELEKESPVHDVWIDEDYKNEQRRELASCIGFAMSSEEEE